MNVASLGTATSLSPSVLPVVWVARIPPFPRFQYQTDTIACSRGTDFLMTRQSP
jgi:hypothetical protein